MRQNICTASDGEPFLHGPHSEKPDLAQAETCEKHDNQNIESHPSPNNFSVCNTQNQSFDIPRTKRNPVFRLRPRTIRHRPDT